VWLAGADLLCGALGGPDGHMVKRITPKKRRVSLRSSGAEFRANLRSELSDKVRARVRDQLRGGLGAEGLHFGFL